MAKTLAQRGDVEQIKDFADREAAIGELQQVFDGDQQRVATALALVGEGEGDETWIIALKLPEYGANVRCVAVDIRNHDDDVAGAQCGVGTEALEQLVVEDFHLALGAVGDVKADRGIVLQIDGRP